MIAAALLYLLVGLVFAGASVRTATHSDDKRRWRLVGDLARTLVWPVYVPYGFVCLAIERHRRRVWASMSVSQRIGANARAREKAGRV